jgi:hypothetical protein
MNHPMHIACYFPLIPPCHHRDIFLVSLDKIWTTRADSWTLGTARIKTAMAYLSLNLETTGFSLNLETTEIEEDAFFVED